jgi:hypothetical protein
MQNDNFDIEQLFVHRLGVNLQPHGGKFCFFFIFLENVARFVSENKLMHTT